ncbi:hypothetical protein G6F37_009700 [Rhizopus arrhizus]|nr:hypothetical protein G6F38_007353 [Rhizopus arrhizus]KAG1154163.1 hypothetical protein G6F37_009700 [Rhizopus arrhizus]
MNQEQKEHSKEAATPIEEDKVEDTIDQQNDPLSAAVSQLQQLTAAETQALIQATAQAMGANNHQQFFSTLDSTNVVLAASIVAAAAASANSATNTNEAERKETTAARTTSTSSGSISNSHSNKRKREIVDLSQLPADLLKRELMNQKVRADNRERKKRWRQQNEERNKDNDLRCRVNKRAHKLFGKEDNEHKRAWIEEEFRKRQQKRKEKERRKGMIDNSLGAAAHVQPNDLNTLTQHFLSPQQHGQQQQLPDINYLTMLCNSLGIAGAARALIGNAAAAFNHTSTPTAAASSSSSETNNVAIESKPDAKTEENPRPEIKNEANVNTDDSILSATSEENMAAQGSPSPSSSTAAVTDNNEVENKDQNKSAASLQLLEFLHHLQQYQPQQQHIIENNNSSTSSELAALPTFPGLEVTRPEEKLAALLATTLHAAAAAATTKEEGPERTASTSSTAPAAEHTEFPLDAVLTLMQLNAGWRQ